MYTHIKHAHNKLAIGTDERTAAYSNAVLQLHLPTSQQIKHNATPSSSTQKLQRISTQLTLTYGYDNVKTIN